MNIIAQKKLREFLYSNPSFYVYHLGNLDEPFKNHTTWLLQSDGEDVQMANLLFTAFNPPTVLCQIPSSTTGNKAFVESLLEKLPKQLYCQCNLEFADILLRKYKAENIVDSYKMGCKTNALTFRQSHDETLPVTPDLFDELEAFYIENYPNGWLNRQMLETGMYRIIRNNGKIVAGGGVHILSVRQRVASLGNIAVKTDERGKGLGLSLINGVCKQLLEYTDFVGLNVDQNNYAAIACYKKLGFSVVGGFREMLLSLKQHS